MLYIQCQQTQEDLLGYSKQSFTLVCQIHVKFAEDLLLSRPKHMGAIRLHSIALHRVLVEGFKRVGWYIHDWNLVGALSFGTDRSSPDLIM